MALNPITDANAKLKRVDEILRQILFTERILQGEKRTGGKKERIAALHKRIMQSMQDLNENLEQAKLAVQYASQDPARKNPNDLRAIKTQLTQIAHFEVRLKNLQQRVLTRMHAIRNDPTMELMKDAPKVNNVDPFEATKMQPVVKSLFGDDGLLKDKSIAKAMLPLNDQDRRLFIEDLAAHVLRNKPGHAQLNAMKVFQQLPIIPFAPEQNLFVSEIRKVNKQITFEALDQTKTPNHELPVLRSKDDTDMPNPPKTPKSPQEERLQKLAIEAVDNGGFAKAKSMLTDPKINIAPNERLDFMVAVREEIEHRKLLEQFANVKISKEQP